MSPSVKQAAPIGAGIVACAACCAAPIAGAIGGIGILGGIAAILAGAVVVGLVLLAIAFGVFTRQRRRRPSSASAVPVDVSAPPSKLGGRADAP